MNEKVPDSKPKRIKKTPLPPSRNEILNRGQEASALLLNPVFNIAVRSAIESWQDALLSSLPGETEVRESMYYRMRALNDVMAELAGFVHIARAMTDREAGEEESAEAAWAHHMAGGL